MGKLREAISDRERPIHHDPDSTIRRKVTRKKQGKIRQFARYFIHLFILTVFNFKLLKRLGYRRICSRFKRVHLNFC